MGTLFDLNWLESSPIGVVKVCTLGLKKACPISLRLFSLVLVWFGIIVYLYNGIKSTRLVFDGMDCVHQLFRFASVSLFVIWSLVSQKDLWQSDFVFKRYLHQIWLIACPLRSFSIFILSYPIVQTIYLFNRSHRPQIHLIVGITSQIEFGLIYWKPWRAV